jgi:hypothetical protein
MLIDNKWIAEFQIDRRIYGCFTEVLPNFQNQTYLQKLNYGIIDNRNQGPLALYFQQNNNISYREEVTQNTGLLA